MAPRPGVNFISLNYPGGLISSRHVLARLHARNCSIMPDCSSTSVIVIGAYNFVSDTMRRSLRTVNRTLGRGNGMVIANYLKTGRSRVHRIRPGILRVAKPRDCRRILRRIRRCIPGPGRGPFLDLIPRRNIGLAPHRCTCLGVSRNYGRHYAFYVVPSVHNSLIDHPVNRILDRTGHLMSTNIGRVLIVSRSASTCNISIGRHANFRGNRPMGADVIDLYRRLSGLKV